ncbi:hypothetical protein L218DRAFT_462765 [Marasmius fiardii PR-910]|nr:hypothetical protein L218DRAFT_462765 [Marasmius fiardii PR-910]
MLPIIMFCRDSASRKRTGSPSVGASLLLHISLCLLPLASTISFITLCERNLFFSLCEHSKLAHLIKRQFGPIFLTYRMDKLDSTSCPRSQYIDALKLRNEFLHSLL